MAQLAYAPGMQSSMVPLPDQEKCVGLLKGNSGGEQRRVTEAEKSRHRCQGHQIVMLILAEHISRDRNGKRYRY
jgi:hypothetical protein